LTSVRACMHVSRNGRGVVVGKEEEEGGGGGGEGGCLIDRVGL